MKLWFTADLHLGHANIIKYCDRPFANVAEMDAALINNWNARVAPDDTVYVVGDFAWKDQYAYLKALNGHKHLVYGNHDKGGVADSSGGGWRSVGDYREIEVRSGGQTYRVVLFHYGMRVWSASNHGSLHFYGHSHGKLPGDSQCCDVGVDCWDYWPVSFEEIKTRLDASPKRERQGAPFPEKEHVAV